VKDFFGTELKEGDTVAFMEPDYRNMITGTIVSFAPKSMLIEWKKVWRHALDGTKPMIKTFRATSEQVIKKAMKNVMFIQHSHEVSVSCVVINSKNFTKQLTKVYNDSFKDRGWICHEGYLDLTAVPLEKLPCVVDEIIDVCVS
jgi:hypothetical protein